MDSLDIAALSIATRIGIHAWEQRINQRLVLTISIPTDFSHCNDDINQTINYEKLCETVTNYVESKTFNLIETVAVDVAELIKKDFNLQTVTISVSKPHAVKNAGDVRVTVTR